MAITVRSDRNLTNQVTFDTIDDLMAWLSSKQIEYSSWGTGSAKNIESLWHEIQSCESLIQDDPPLRMVITTQVLVFQHGNMLIEYEQEFSDGRRRVRSFRPSEKVKPGETYQTAAVRCLHEELGLSLDRIHLIDATYLYVIMETGSLSYPGLRARYTTHVVEAKVDGLPDTEFWTEESNPTAHEMVTRHHWIWR